MSSGLIVSKNSTSIILQDGDGRAPAPAAAEGGANTSAATGDTVVSAATVDAESAAKKLASAPSGAVGTPGVGRWSDSTAATNSKTYSRLEIEDKLDVALQRFQESMGGFEIDVSYADGKAQTLTITSTDLTPEQRATVLTTAKRVLMNYPINPDTTVSTHRVYSH